MEDLQNNNNSEVNKGSLYASRLTQSTEKILKDKPNVLENKPKTTVAAKSKEKKAVKEVRKINLPFSVSESEKEWIEEQVKIMSETVGVNISVSAFIRMKALADMPKKDS